MIKNNLPQKCFTGFSVQSIRFLEDVSSLNSKMWFADNRSLYEQFLLEPFRDLVTDLGASMLKIDPGFEVRPQINKTISGIFRDTRFSKDKKMFKRAMWLTFKRPSRDWKDAPAYFFELMIDSYRYGLGYYSASRSTMDTFRRAIDENQKEFLKAISFQKLNPFIELKGDKYKRSIGCDHPEIIQDWYQRKSFYLVRNKPINNILFSSRLTNDVLGCFSTLAPLYKFLRKHIHPV
jgi:uncharacterized protein (TIGR02453 family)